MGKSRKTCKYYPTCGSGDNCARCLAYAPREALARKPQHVADDIAALLIKSAEDEQIDTGDAVVLLGDAYDTLRAVVAQEAR